MKTIKDEPIEVSNTVNQLLHLHDYDQLTKHSFTNSTQKCKEVLIDSSSSASTCAWCQQLGNQLFTLQTDNDDAKTLCSEVCFNRYRRASFKKQKKKKDPKLSKIHQTMKSTNDVTTERKVKSTVNEIHHQDINRRKLISLSRHSMQSKPEFSPNPSSFLSPPPPPIGINHFQYPFFVPSSQTTSSESFPSTLFPPLTKDFLSNYTCILPSFIPLPIPIPISLCVKCSIDVINEQCQTDQKQTRRMSF